MKVSIIIVNYKVKEYTCQCIYSVKKALKNIKGEIIVIDNFSEDNSTEYIKSIHSDITVIENKENLGFSKANNIGIRISKGEHILLLNPDTIVQEDVFEQCLNYIEKVPNVGALGIKMINGEGKFLPESKRGIPSLWVTFCKTLGLSKLFPKSALFSKYYLGYLPENSNNEIEILSGAFMWLKRSTVDDVGVLDETFFMYGEDIDLSYRILIKGYKNYYLSDSKILHYKGESSKKISVKYIFNFHKAMLIFTKKHFYKKFTIPTIVIYSGIYLRAFLVMCYNIIAILYEKTNLFITNKLKKKEVIIIVGDYNFIAKIEAKKKNNSVKRKLVKIKNNDTIESNDSKIYNGRLYQLKDFIEIYKGEKVFFCSDSVSYSTFLNNLSFLKSMKIKTFISYNNLLISNNLIINL